MGTAGDAQAVQHGRPNSLWPRVTILLSVSTGISHGLPYPKA